MSIQQRSFQSSRSVWTVLVALLGAAVIVTSCVSPPSANSRDSRIVAEWPRGIDASGLSCVDESTLCFVSDCKESSDVLWVIGKVPERCSPCKVDIGGLPTENHLLPFDVESISALAPHDGYAIMLESGKDSARRRLFCLRFKKNEPGCKAADVVGKPVNLKQGAVAIIGDIESMALQKFDPDLQTATALVAGRVEFKAKDPRPQDGRADVTIWRITVDFMAGLMVGNPEKVCVVKTKLPMPVPPIGAEEPSWRGCSDLAVGPDNRLWMASTFDGDNDGPFSSIISCFQIDAGQYADGAVHCEATEQHQVAGHKIEGLFISADGRTLWAASDDENNGGRLFKFEIGMP